MMDILINSLYTNRDIFLREIISNAADALDKIRFIGLTDKAALGEGEMANLDVKIRFDKETRTITFTDKGVGMTKDELIKNLGVVARSGTSEFVEAASSGKGDALALIGQFGVGFYSVYLVADKVTVTSKSYKDEDQYVWESTANSVFTIAKDPRGNTLERGTEITLHLKEDADEFLSEHKLIELASKYSQFINFPIYVQVTKTITEEVEEPAKTDSDSEVEIEDEDASTPSKKTVTRVVTEDQRVNAVKAIWTRKPADITDEEYNEFYKSLTKDSRDPSTKLHFTAEGDITFKSILYVPSAAEHGLYDRFYETANTVKLYVRRVLISDQFKDFLPRYMNFVKGVVDSDDLPLNVNRETLAQSRVLKVMSKKISRKVLEMLKKMAAEEKRAQEKEERAERDDPENENEDEDEDEDNDSEGSEYVGKKLYTPFWNEFGKSIKLGVLEDAANKNQLVKLLRFKSLNSDDKLISLEDYVDAMGDGQKSIFFMTGESIETIMASPFIAAAKKKNVDVLLLADPLDEYVVNALPEFDGTPLQSLARDGASFGDEKKNLLKRQAAEFKPLIDVMQRALGQRNVNKVVVSQRLADTPMVIVSDAYGWSANMERIMKSQAFGDQKQAKYMTGKRTAEINPYHPIIKALNDAVQKEGEEKANVMDLIELLHESALLQSGFQISEPADFAKRVNRVISTSLDIDPSAVVESEPSNDIEEVQAEAQSVETPAGVEEEEEDEEEAESPVKDEL